jgi:TRAP-type mannitol/chloroaromatic compound transport system permease small subunit
LGVDKASQQFGHLAAFAVLAAALISAGNAFIRYGLDISSNGWLEIQWYLFAATVMLGAPLVLKLNEHVRVDIFYGQLKGNAPVYIDLLGLVVFLLPVEQCRGPDPLAGHAAVAVGLCMDVPARVERNHQARGLLARQV